MRSADDVMRCGSGSAGRWLSLRHSSATGSPPPAASLSQYYTRQTFAEAAGELFEILDTGSYVEDSADDSLYVVLRRPPENRERPSAA